MDMIVFLNKVSKSINKIVKNPQVYVVNLVKAGSREFTLTSMFIFEVTSRIVDQRLNSLNFYFRKYQIVKCRIH